MPTCIGNEYINLAKMLNNSFDRLGNLLGFGNCRSMMSILPLRSDQPRAYHQLDKQHSSHCAFLPDPGTSQWQLCSCDKSVNFPTSFINNI